MAFNDCVNMLDAKNDYGQNICPYSPATSFACPYGSTESASAYCPKYTNLNLYSPEGGMGGHYFGGGSGSTSSPIVIEYSSDPNFEKIPTSLDYLKKARYCLEKAIESMERENNDE